MTRTRRVLVLIGLTLAVTIGATIPASATFTDTTTPVVHTVSTGTVAAPASVTVNDFCSTTTSAYWNGWTWVTTTTNWYTATVSWPASTTARGVTGYRVMAHLNNGQSVVMGETDAVARTVRATVDRSYLNYQPTLSVITLTSYGWTAETARTAVLGC